MRLTLNGILLLTLSCLFLWTSELSADVIHVPEEQPTIQAGLGNTSPGDTVLVAPGVYQETVQFPPFSVVLASNYLISGDPGDIEITVIDGGSSGTPVVIDSNQDQSCALIGFTIRNGFSWDDGGGVFVSSASPRIEWNHIHSNSSDRGGGILLLNSSSYIAHNIIEDNEFFSPSGNPGGGIAVMEGSDAEIAFNTIRNNHNQDGGGIAVFSSEAFIHNNVIHDNNGQDVGGGLRIDQGSDVLMMNNTIVNNTSTYGGGITVWGVGTQVTMKNSILVGNTASQEGQQINGGEGLIVTYSNIEDGWTGTGNIDVDPLFRDAEDGDYHLQSANCGDPADSPCIDIGDPEIFDDVLDCGFGLGDVRSDMGAYGGVGTEIPVVQLVLNPTSLAFDSLAPGESVSQTVNLSNTGTTNLVIENVEVPEGYRIIEAWPLTLEPNTNIDASVWFEPTEVGDYVDTIFIISNDPDSPTPLPVEGYCREVNTISDRTEGGLPSRFTVSDPYPNPFNPEVSITITLPAPAHVTITLYDVAGRLVRAVAVRRFSAGTTTISIQGQRLTTGLYFCRFESGGQVLTRKMMLLK
ncbi:MAG TPA: T9SS type A sorting domain-containing protein [Bacteroidetes bacterium]|nr:hypothetical protein BMS3Bbin04_01672 [bacterium BMS3Bbin04]HDO65860.1 T9SS type A sorting domain-containing protein [Bacteroidota bacterium]HEX04985.1 T9SS type A sorting domain-containing protein [Bacteroidota bacterium]